MSAKRKCDGRAHSAHRAAGTAPRAGAAGRCAELIGGPGGTRRGTAGSGIVHARSRGKLWRPRLRRILRKRTRRSARLVGRTRLSPRSYLGPGRVVHSGPRATPQHVDCVLDSVFGSWRGASESNPNGRLNRCSRRRVRIESERESATDPERRPHQARRSHEPATRSRRFGCWRGHSID